MKKEKGQNNKTRRFGSRFKETKNNYSIGELSYWYYFAVSKNFDSTDTLQKKICIQINKLQGR